MFRPSSQTGDVPRFTVQTAPKQKIPQEEQSKTLFSDEPFDVIGCVFQTYWIVTRNDIMFLIDQHAAHERKLYDDLAARRIETSSQALLVPREVALTPSEMSVWEANQNTVSELGFGSVRTGALTLTLHEIPMLNGQMLHEAYLHTVLSILSENGKNMKDTLVRERLMQAACKHAVKGGEAIGREEIGALLDSFMKGEMPLTCPHGRPVIVRISKTELEKMFRRIV
jgi:DNA mismatch repair protein MutL